MSEELLNIDALDDLRSVLGDEFFDLAQMFARQLQVEVKALLQCHERGDMPQLKRLAHSLKGASANMGALALAQLANAIERAALAEDKATVDSLMPQLTALADQSLEAMRSAGYLVNEG
ncbi:Hpt domain-containing protein [Hydrogenophaga aquatica]